MKQESSTALSPDNQSGTVFFLDKFIIPVEALASFSKQMQFNRNFIRLLEGFITDYAISRQTDDGDIELITVAIWRDLNSLDNAKKIVQEEYKRIGFNPALFLQELKITMERQLYNAFENS